MRYALVLVLFCVLESSAFAQTSCPAGSKACGQSFFMFPPAPLAVAPPPQVRLSGPIVNSLVQLNVNRRHHCGPIRRMLGRCQ